MTWSPINSRQYMQAQCLLNHYRSKMLEVISKPGYFTRHLPPQPHPSLRIRLRKRIEEFLYRVRDAYFVLIGKAEISDE